MATKILIRWDHPTSPASIAIKDGQLFLRQGRKQAQSITAIEGLTHMARWFVNSSQPGEAGSVDIGGAGMGMMRLVERVSL